MPITSDQYQEILRRLDKNPKREPADEMPEDAAKAEIEELHTPIMQWCANQVPAIPYIHSHPYRKTTIGKGAPDFIICYQGHTLWIECKTATNKLSPDQIAFKMLLEMQHAEYYVVRSMAYFHGIIDEINRIELEKNPDEKG